ncbi:flagellar biosynthetic protein FliO [Nitrosomonas sp.]|uniref:flagellar biosynthetic protein FliO n=1 Tax=Nitrosomonas sp. TaxID=42353 RepID=UPI0026347AD5|nr:flagellar biosynthetic protein FliO [Nitrosomonas sp.]
MLNRYWIFLGWMLPLHALAETAKSGYVPPPSVVSTESTLQMMGGLILVLAVIAGITWLLKRFALIPTTATGTLKVVAATGVGQRERVVVVEIDNTWLVLGVAPGRVNKLHTMDKPALGTTDKTQNSQPTETFAVQLNESIQKNNA